MGGLRVTSRSDEPFRDRREAGELLSRELREYSGADSVVLGIPRGGLIVAQVIAGALNADLDVALAHKLRTPGHPELAIGSVSEDGKVFLNERIVRELNVRQGYIESERNRQMAENARRVEMIRKVSPKIPLNGRNVIVTDDGVATGATMEAALWAARQEGPAKLIAALPVAPEDALVRLAEAADETICLRSPMFFIAIGQFYLHFEQISDQEVLRVLSEERQRRVAP